MLHKLSGVSSLSLPLHLFYIIPFSCDITSQMVDAQTYKKNGTSAGQWKNRANRLQGMALRKRVRVALIRKRAV